MSWCWVALLGPDRHDAPVWAEVRDPDGNEVGVLAAWPEDTEPTEGAAKIDSRAIDPDGAAAEVSLVLAPEGMSVPFDDPAVGHAIRQILALPPAEVVTTLLQGDSRFVGSLTAVRGPVGRLDADPFARLFPARRLSVDAGFLGTIPPPTGPVGQRYGSANPWPWDRFS